MTTKPALQKIFKGILHTDGEDNSIVVLKPNILISLLFVGEIPIYLISVAISISIEDSELYYLAPIVLCVGFRIFVNTSTV
jgi:hypothetical protein